MSEVQAENLTKKVIPGKRRLYIEQLEESIEELEKVPVI